MTSLATPQSIFPYRCLVHSTRNEASCKVALAAGFAPEGTLRESGKHVDGWYDMHLHARLAG
ncbi:N-acetyltransferase [Oerskovia turbata]|uniref:N-acetyltransferase n=1 Tax=Oerskovia turbata TaxID=1713 RepID=A0A4V1N4J9_9CELL|nr:GNAT family protein [Oerskovia turbata]RXR22361.1 N-acetyltransferase [Oerskovia turbata]RXR32426.1 N-acetyltransferase [Oerskovia turbata]